jgi:mRNA interferase RelE/StbE
LRRLRIPAAVAERIRGLHPEIKCKVRAALKAVLEDPRAGKVLKDELEGLRSYRIGRYRVIYRIGRQGVIEVVAVGPRQRIYEETYRLLRRRG